MLSRQGLVWNGLSCVLVCSALLVPSCSHERVSKPTVQFSDLLTLRRELPLVTHDSSLAPSGFLTLAHQRSGLVASDPNARRLLAFDSTGHCTSTYVLDSLTGPQCYGRRLICVSEHDSQVYSYDPLTNSVYRLKHNEFVRIPLDNWRVDRWGATERRVVAIGPAFSEEPKISVRAIEGLQINPVCDITQELDYPHLYPQIGYPNAICMKEDDGFYVLEAASMKILEYSPDGKFMRRSTEVPEGFVPPSADTSYRKTEDMFFGLASFTTPLSIGRIGKYLLVFWLVQKEPSIYLEVYDESLRLRLTRIKAPAEDFDPSNMYTSGNSLFLLRRAGLCKLPNVPVKGTKPQSASPPVLVEFTFNESVVESS